MQVVYAIVKVYTFALACLSCSATTLGLVLRAPVTLPQTMVNETKCIIFIYSLLLRATCRT